MDKRTIYSKTGKGSLEISKKTIKLASDERQALILVDGKSSVGEIEEKLSRVSPVRLRAILDRLAELDLVREFVTKQGPDSIMPSLGGPTAMKVEELDELDFTALSAAPAVADPAREVEERRQAALAAEEQAAQARAQEAQRRQAEEDARRRADEEAARAAEEAQRQKEAEEARHRAEEESRRKAEDDARRKAADEEARRNAEEEARRRAAEEDARRRAEEEARRKAEEESRRRAAEEAERREREEAEARERERREREEAERRDRARREEEARRAAAAEEKRRQEQERADAEAARARAEEEQREREAAERREREEAERRERARRDEEAKRAVIAEEKRRREQAEADAASQAASQAEARERERAETERRTNEEAARYTAALTPHLEDATPAPESLDLDFNPKDTAHTGGIESLDLKPLAGGGPDTFADTGMSANSVFEAELADETPNKKSVEKEARRELEREAKENAKAAARAKKDAEREAKEQAKQSKVKIRRGGGSGFSMGKFIAVFIVLMIAGGIGYLYFMPIDKAVIESMTTARLGVQVKVGSAKFQPFPPQLLLTDVVVDDIRLPRVTAIPDPGSLAADHKIWNSIEVAGATIDARQAEKLIAISLQEAPRGVAMTIQRVRVTGLSVTGTPVALPAMDVNALLGADGVRQVTFSLPENKGQLQLVRDEKGWLFDFESRATTWALGPKTAWESLRAKGLAKTDGLHFDNIALTHFGGTATGGGDLYWTGGYRFNGSVDVGGMETGGIAQAYYGASPVAGTLDGKFKVTMNAPALNRLIESTQLEGSVVVNKAAVSNIDLARSAQAEGLTPGQTRFSDFAADLVTSGAKVQIKNVRANSGLLNVSGNVDISPERALSGVINVELGISSNRTKAALKVSGTPADPKLNK